MSRHDAADHAAILAELTDIFRSVFDDRALEPSPETTADDIPAWDSLNHIALVVEIECRFGICFHAAEIEELKSVGELLGVIAARRAPAPA